MTYYDTSAKEGLNVNKAFNNLARTLKEKADLENESQDTNTTSGKSGGSKVKK